MGFVDIINRLVLALADAAPLALVTLGIVLIFRTSFTTNFAQGMISTCAAYVTTVFYNRYYIINFPQASLVFGTLISFFLGIIVGYLIGVFIDTVLIRKSKFSNVLTKQMITMGMVLFIMGLLPTLFFKADLNMPSIPRFFTETIRIPVGDKFIIMQQNNLFSIVVATLIILAVFLALKYTKWGLGVRATASNEKVASLMGVNTKKITAFSWGIAGAIGSVGAILYATSQTVTSFLMSDMQVNGFLASVLGGFSTFYGPVIGAIIIPILNLISYILSPLINLGVYYKMFVYIIILIIILIKPIGLFGKKIAKKV